MAQENFSQSSTSSLTSKMGNLSLVPTEEIDTISSIHTEPFADGSTDYLDPRVFNNFSDHSLAPIIEEEKVDDFDKIEPSWELKDEHPDQNNFQNLCYNGVNFHEPWRYEEEHLMDEEQYESTTSVNSSILSSSLSSAQSMNSSRNRNSKVTEGSVSGIKLSVDRANFSTRYHDDTIFLMKYYNKDKTKHPKKEYIRAQLIRAHKKVLRQIQNNRPLAKVIKNLDVKSQEIIRIIGEIKQHFFDYFDVLKEESKTESGPNTDGKCKRNAEAEHKSWNNAYVKSYFSKPAVQKAYLLFIELFFAEASTETICKRANIYCCKKSKHDAECQRAWEEMKHFFTDTMLSNVGVNVCNLKIDHFALIEVEGVPPKPEGFGNSDIASFLNE
ncbi:unnamed protein product [Blepharisma stoltei]|uniref:Uncharacterized protein n=1 Tax=Blepharisma stoltei TaxID=1481888 RepID=A0AAU9J301_9CILI|nr:unnamed protein product [Blepharisma stoltei]